MARYVGEQGEWYYANDFRFLLRRAIFIRRFTIVRQRGFFSRSHDEIDDPTTLNRKLRPGHTYDPAVNVRFFCARVPRRLCYSVKLLVPNRTFPPFGKCSSTSPPSTGSRYCVVKLISSARKRIVVFVSYAVWKNAYNTSLPCVYRSVNFPLEPYAIGPSRSIRLT